MFTILVFNTHPVVSGVQAKHFFPNGYGVSVVGGGVGLCGNGETTFEVAVIKGNEENFDLVYDTDIADDVLGYQSKKDVSNIMKQVSKLPAII